MFDITLYLNGLNRLFSSLSYGQTLEQYIVSNKPLDSIDVERLTDEWHRIHTGGWYRG